MFCRSQEMLGLARKKILVNDDLTKEQIKFMVYKNVSCPEQSWNTDSIDAENWIYLRMSQLGIKNRL